MCVRNTAFRHLEPRVSIKGRTPAVLISSLTPSHCGERSGPATHRLLFHLRLRAQPRARQGPQGIGWKLGAKASGFYFCELGRPRAMSLIRAWGSGVSSVEATHKPLQRPGAQDIEKNWQRGILIKVKLRPRHLGRKGLWFGFWSISRI